MGYTLEIKRKRLLAGFSMIELLTVIGIMAVLATVVVFKNPSPGSSLNSAQNMTISLLSTTRSCAIMKGQRARLIISRDVGEAGFLRRIGIIYESEKNSNQWIAADEGATLPKNIFYTPYKLVGIENPSDIDLAESDRTGSMKIKYPMLSIQKEKGPGWYYYEFGASGMADYLTTSNKSVVLYAGRLDAESRPVIENEFAVAGFKINPNGSCITINSRKDLN